METAAVKDAIAVDDEVVATMATTAVLVPRMMAILLPMPHSTLTTVVIKFGVVPVAVMRS